MSAVSLLREIAMYYFIEIACVIAEMWLVHMFLGSYYDKRNCSILQPLGMYCNLRSPTATGAVVNGHSAVHQRSA